jgi:hypothetical protein
MIIHDWQEGRLSSGKYVGTTCLRAAGSSPAPPAVWVFWRLIWRTGSLDRGLILVCRFSFVSNRECIQVAALVYKVGCTCVTLYCSQMGKRLSQRWGNMRRFIYLFIYFISFNVIQPMWLCRQILTHKIADMSERSKQANKQRKTKQHT